MPYSDMVKQGWGICQRPGAFAGFMAEDQAQISHARPPLRVQLQLISGMECQGRAVRHNSHSTIDDDKGVQALLMGKQVF